MGSTRYGVRPAWLLRLLQTGNPYRGISEDYRKLKNTMSFSKSLGAANCLLAMTRVLWCKVALLRASQWTVLCVVASCLAMPRRLKCRALQQPGYYTYILIPLPVR